MKKQRLILMIILLFTSSVIYSAVFSITTNLNYSFDTNIFSNPLPTMSSSQEWLLRKNKNPLMRRHNIGLDINFDYFPHENARIGMSSSLELKFPIKSIASKPIPDNKELGFTGNWEYYHYETTESQQVGCFGSFGPIFKIYTTHVDYGITLRLSLGAMQYNTPELILGLQIEPFANFHINDSIYISTRFTYDSHFMRFKFEGTEIFEPYFQLVSLKPSLGVGFKF